MYFYKKKNNFVAKYMYTKSKTCEVLYFYKINPTNRNMNFTMRQ